MGTVCKNPAWLVNGKGTDFAMKKNESNVKQVIVF